MVACNLLDNAQLITLLTGVAGGFNKYLENDVRDPILLPLVLGMETSETNVSNDSLLSSDEFAVRRALY